MSAGTAGPAASEIPTFSECVIGYRRWWMDDRGYLWPLWKAKRPWGPGRNVARCEHASPTSLRFESRVVDGRRVLEPVPDHVAPADQCSCGLYSWRRPRALWYSEPWRSTPPSVIGAVACWGRMQVHADGFRAEYAAIVVLAWHPDISTPGLNVLGHIAHNYRAELVEVGRLEEAARRHGSALPDSLYKAVEPPLLEPRPRPLRPHPSLTTKPAPEEPQVRRDVALVLLGVILAVAGVLLLTQSSVSWFSGGQRPHAGTAQPVVGNEWAIIGGGLCVVAGGVSLVAGVWGLWSELGMDLWRVRRRAKAAADRSAHSRAWHPR